MQRLRRLVRQAFAVSGVVVQDGDLLALEMLRQIVARDLALLPRFALAGSGLPSMPDTGYERLADAAPAASANAIAKSTACWALAVV
jgi:hypothetical protein